MNSPHPDRGQELLATALLGLTEPPDGLFDLYVQTARLVGYGSRLVQEAEIGVLMADNHGTLHPVAASTETAFVFTDVETAAADGPSRRTYISGMPATSYHLTAPRSRWPHLSELAAHAGYHSLHLVAMRHRQAHHGVLSFYRPTTTPYSPDDRTCAQALADGFAIGLTHHDAQERQQALAEHIQHAFATRLAIERANGLLSERLGITPSAAYEVLRANARPRGTTVGALAQGLLDGTVNWLPQSKESVRNDERALVLASLPVSP